MSAITVRTPNGLVIINNPQHSAGRQNSNIIHELAYLILKHRPGANQTIYGSMLRGFDEVQEAEAALLGEALLVPRISLQWTARRQIDLAMTARWLGASEDLVDTAPTPLASSDSTGAASQVDEYLRTRPKAERGASQRSTRHRTVSFEGSPAVVVV
ncbi:ImmA/IrrE family metallo-endopeptidase [Nonomuraea sp. NBC_00507]|uniref:ImmA/IrrE family metallo-endopeptidase n=1 Tax=Nonomuraea sp. NBC_00507 TaxID=2976002 RepID=UPI002E18442B